LTGNLEALSDAEGPVGEGRLNPPPVLAEDGVAPKVTSRAVIAIRLLSTCGVRGKTVLSLEPAGLADGLALKEIALRKASFPIRPGDVAVSLVPPLH
jgi:hypothetical protein